MGKHDNKSTVNGQGNYDPTKTKNVQEAGDGKRSSADKGDEGHEDGEGDSKE